MFTNNFAKDLTAGYNPTAYYILYFNDRLAVTQDAEKRLEIEEIIARYQTAMDTGMNLNQRYDAITTVLGVL